VDGEKLVRCISASLRRKRHQERRTHEKDQGDPDFTNLGDKALCCAIVPCRDDPVVSPPDIKDTTNCLQKFEHEKRELLFTFNEPSKWQQKSYQADHVDISRLLEQLPVSMQELLPIPSYVALCNISSNRTNT